MTAEELLGHGLLEHSGRASRPISHSQGRVSRGSSCALVETTLTLLDTGYNTTRVKITQADLYSQVGQHLLQSTGNCHSRIWPN